MKKYSIKFVVIIIIIIITIIIIIIIINIIFSSIIFNWGGSKNLLKGRCYSDKKKLLSFFVEFKFELAKYLQTTEFLYTLY